MRDYDVLLLGTSPLMMIQALHFHHQGERVALLERNSQVGGSWYTRDLWRFKSLEFSVHELLERPGAYRFLREKLGLELVPEPESYGLVGDRRVPIARYRLEEVIRSAPGAARRGGWKAIWGTREEYWRRLHFRNVVPHYLKGGGQAMLERLREMLGAAGVPVLLDTTARGIDLDSDRKGGVCRTSAGDLRFSQMVLGQSAHCPITVDGSPFSFESTDRQVTTVFLYLDGEAGDLSPFCTWTEPSVRRFRSIGAFVDPPLPEGELLLALATRASEYSDEKGAESTAHALLDRLTTLGVVSPSAQLIDFHFENYYLNKVEKPEIRRMARALQPGILAMETWDLAECLETRCRSPRILSLPDYEA